MMDDRETCCVSERQERMESSPVLHASRLGILVAEDDESIRQLLDGVLGCHGFRVWLAADGQEALEIFGQEAPHIDIVLLDVCMPRLNGPLALKAMRELKADLRCCFMSGNIDTFSEQDLWDLGALRIFSKPFSMSAAADTLRRLAAETPVA